MTITNTSLRCLKIAHTQILNNLCYHHAVKLYQNMRQLWYLAQESVSIVPISMRNGRSWQGATRQHGRPHVTSSNDARNDQGQRIWVLNLRFLALAYMRSV